LEPRHVNYSKLMRSGSWTPLSQKKKTELLDRFQEQVFIDSPPASIGMGYVLGQYYQSLGYFYSRQRDYRQQDKDGPTLDAPLSNWGS
jgi:hypothetical protein